MKPKTITVAMRYKDENYRNASDTAQLCPERLDAYFAVTRKSPAPGYVQHDDGKYYPRRIWVVVSSEQPTSKQHLTFYPRSGPFSEWAGLRLGPAHYYDQALNAEALYCDTEEWLDKHFPAYHYGCLHAEIELKA